MMWWERWLLPERPGLRQFWLVALAFTLPICGLAGPTRYLPIWIVVGMTGGCGLALGWAVVRGRVWLGKAPVVTVLVLASGAAGAMHLRLLPQYETAVRASAATRDISAWRPGSDLPTYDAGPRRLVFVPGSGPVLAWTREPLQRWTPFGWRDACRVVLRADGAVVEKCRDESP